MKKLLIKKLEKQKANVDLFEEVLKEISDEDRPAFMYLIDLAYSLEFGNPFYVSENKSFRELPNKAEYAIVGGYGLLIHLTNFLGERYIGAWRGSDDIDLVGSESLYSQIRSIYNGRVLSDNVSPNLKNKRTIKIQGLSDNGYNGKIDLTILQDHELRETMKQTTHCHMFGIPLRVASPEVLIKYKLPAALKEDLHSKDIVKLLFVTEKLDLLPKQLFRSITKDERYMLRKVLQKENDPYSGLRGPIPSRQYFNDLIKQGKSFCPSDWNK